MSEQKPLNLPEMQLLEAAWLAQNIERQALLETPYIKPLQISKLAKNLAKIAEQSQRLVQAFLENQAKPDANFTVPDPAIIGKAFLEMTWKMLADPAKLIQAQVKFWQDYMNLLHNTSERLLGYSTEPVVKPHPSDKRFKEEDWAKNIVFDFIKQSYLLAARSIQQTVKQVEGLDAKTAERVDFYTRQFVDALSPTNFALTNPKVLKVTLESSGENLIKGLSNLLDDLERGKGRLKITMTDVNAFRPGVNVAVTPGKVIYQTELMQLNQYNPSTEKVFRRPLLIVPPWINKYYILDLRPDNSLVKWAVDQGFTVFVISWVNPDAKLAEVDFENYLSRGTLAALDAIEKATGEREINAIGYCIGGTLLFCTLAYLAAHGDERIKSATGFTTMLDYTHMGELSVFIDEEQFTHIDKGMEVKGYLEGRHMANVFNLLRANDLIWSFVIKNYLLGEEPFPFDLLFWNSDSTRMPKRMHSFYLRNMYLNNKLREPGGITLLQEPLDLHKITVPVFFLSAKEDHIAPWKGTYGGTHLTSGPVKFVLGESGHIAGVVNPPAANKYGYWTNDELPATPEEWLMGAQEHSGSWWPHWLEWVKAFAGDQLKARVPGDGALEPIEDAPGAYVLVRSE
jgi:polyhydroxyalkanoate synthase